VVVFWVRHLFISEFWGEMPVKYDVSP